MSKYSHLLVFVDISNILIAAQFSCDNDLVVLDPASLWKRCSGEEEVPGETGSSCVG